MIVVVLLSRERHFVVGNLENGRRQTSPLSLSLPPPQRAHESRSFLPGGRACFSARCCLVQPKETKKRGVIRELAMTRPV